MTTNRIVIARDGQTMNLGEVPELERQVAVTIAFGSDAGKWWDNLHTARACIQIMKEEMK